MIHGWGHLNYQQTEKHLFGVGYEEVLLSHIHFLNDSDTHDVKRQ